MLLGAAQGMLGMHVHVQFACADCMCQIACALHISNVNTLFIVVLFTGCLMILKQNPLQLDEIFSPKTMIVLRIGVLVLLKYPRQRMNHIPLKTFPHLVLMTSLLPAHHQML